MSGARNRYGGARLSSRGVCKVLSFYFTVSSGQRTLSASGVWGSESTLFELDEPDTVSKQTLSSEVILLDGP